MSTAPRFWPAEERLLSPFASVLFGATGASTALALMKGDFRIAAASVAMLATIATWQDVFEAQWLHRLEQRYARSCWVLTRLDWRHRRRQAVRRLLPWARRVARVTVPMVGIAIIALITVATMGVSLPAEPTGTLAAIQMATRTLSTIAYASLIFTLIAGRAVRDWDRAAASPPCESPIVSGAEIAAKFAQETPGTVVRLLGLVPLIVAWTV